MRRHLHLARAAIARAESRDEQAQRCPDVRSRIHSGCDIVSRRSCQAVVCLAHISANSTGFKEGLPTHELNPIDGSVTPVQPHSPTSFNSSRARRQLPAVIASASTSIVGITFSYSVTVTQCRPVFTVQFALNGFGTSIVRTVAGQYGPNEIPFLNSQTLSNLIPGAGPLISSILRTVGVRGWVAYTVRAAHNGASFEVNLILSLCYRLSGAAWWIARIARRPTSGCCCEFQAVSIDSGIGLGALGLSDPCTTTLPPGLTTLRFNSRFWRWDMYSPVLASDDVPIHNNC